MEIVQTRATYSEIEHATDGIAAGVFRGELVPQDRNNEPASVIFDRIKAKREGALTPNGRRRAS